METTRGGGWKNDEGKSISTPTPYYGKYSLEFLAQQKKKEKKI